MMPAPPCPGWRTTPRFRWLWNACTFSCRSASSCSCRGGGQGTAQGREPWWALHGLLAYTGQNESVHGQPGRHMHREGSACVPLGSSSQAAATPPRLSHLRRCQQQIGIVHVLQGCCNPSSDGSCLHVCHIHRLQPSILPRGQE